MYLQKPVFVATFSLIVLSAAAPWGPWPQVNYPVAKHIIPLYPPKYVYNGVYSADIIVGSQTLRASLDTGSADTFFVTANTNCTELGTLKPAPPAECGYAGTRYVVDQTFEAIPDMNFNITYGFGGNAYGPVGYSEIQIGGLVVPKQEISPVSYASVAYYPQGNISGNVGLAYPGVTSVFPGSDAYQDVDCPANGSNPDCGPIPYSPLMTTMFNDGLTSPVFAFALSRSKTSGGVMAIGGIPPVADEQVNVTAGNVATVAIEPTGNGSVLTVYTITVDGFQYPGAAANAGQGKYFLDTGTMPNELDPAQAEVINSLFEPPAVFDKEFGKYQVACDAVAPRFGVSIGGQIFYHNPEDMIIPPPYGLNSCVSAVQPGLSTGEYSLLGASFMKNVLAVFDVGGTALTLASRPYYEDS